jgi:hypothetical protein
MLADESSFDGASDRPGASKSKTKSASGSGSLTGIAGFPAGSAPTRRTGIAGFPAGSPPTRLDAASAASELIKRAHAQSPAPRRGMGNRPGSRAADRAPGASSPRHAKPAESRRSQSVPARCRARLSGIPQLETPFRGPSQLALLRPRTLPAHPQSYELLIRSLLSAGLKGPRQTSSALGPLRLRQRAGGARRRSVPWLV